MSKEKIIQLRSEGEAHLYIAITKIDGIVTNQEKVSAFFYSKNAISLIDLLGIDPIIKNNIVNNIKSILNDKNTELWDFNHHLEKSLELFKESKSLGDHNIHLIFDKHIEGLSRVAEVDNYLYIESKVLAKLKETFKNL
jgi:hypothetical protein